MNMNQASATLINNKHKLQCGGQHASTKTHEIYTHFVDQKNSLSCYIYINNPFPNGITKLITKDLSLLIYKVILRTLNSIMTKHIFTNCSFLGLLQLLCYCYFSFLFFSKFLKFTFERLLYLTMKFRWLLRIKIS